MIEIRGLLCSAQETREFILVKFENYLESAMKVMALLTGKLLKATNSLPDGSAVLFELEIHNFLLLLQ